MSQTYRRAQTTVSLINYHFVFCPRYRRKVLVGAVEERLKILLSEICEKIEIQILAVECDKDH
ncbi:MAG TPA: IS200/IS605 family transposase [Proteiniclasticum sp.]|nr:IS200/IS605 family transposase [Proteiniclasticum sp.]